MEVTNSIVKNFRYSIVTPVRNEENVIRKTINAVINQTIRPQKWIFLDDGSTDLTAEILDEYASKNAWIKVIHTKKVLSSYEGVQVKLKMAFDLIDISQNDFIGKLDADIEIESTYFENLIKKFIDDKNLGIAGGTLFNIINGVERIEENPEDHVRGGLKLYRIQCWKDIDGIEFKLGYDTIDEIKASMYGWKTRSYKDCKGIHHRPTGQQKGVFGIFLYQGKLAFLVGYHPLFLILKSIKDMTKWPYILGGLAELGGFIKCYFIETERSINDKDFISFLRKMQIKKILRIRNK